MPLATSVIIAGVALAGAATSTYGMYEQKKGNERMAAASRRTEKLNQERMRLEAANQRRKAFREMLGARSMATSNAVAAGAFYGSGTAGGLSSISAEYGRQSGIINTNERIGSDIFAANADYSYGRGTAQTGAGLVSLGKDIFASAGAIGRIGTMAGPGVPGQWQTATFDPAGNFIPQSDYSNWSMA